MNTHYINESFFDDIEDVSVSTDEQDAWLDSEDCKEFYINAGNLEWTPIMIDRIKSVFDIFDIEKYSFNVINTDAKLPRHYLFVRFINSCKKPSDFVNFFVTLCNQYKRTMINIDYKDEFEWDGQIHVYGDTYAKPMSLKNAFQTQRIIGDYIPFLKYFYDEDVAESYMLLKAATLADVTNRIAPNVGVEGLTTTSMPKLTYLDLSVAKHILQTDKNKVNYCFYLVSVVDSEDDIFEITVEWQGGPEWSAGSTWPKEKQKVLDIIKKVDNKKVRCIQRECSFCKSYIDFSSCGVFFLGDHFGQYGFPDLRLYFVVEYDSKYQKELEDMKLWEIVKE